MRIRPPFWPAIALATLVMALDQASKWWILKDVMAVPEVKEIFPFFNLVLAWNRGVSFGLFNNGSALNAWILPILTGGIAIGLIIWLSKIDDKKLAFAIGLVIGGAIGNLIDRIVHGAVVDFLDVHVAGYHWPAFNVADSAICIGAAVLILDSLFSSDEKLKKNENEAKRKP